MTGVQFSRRWRVVSVDPFLSAVPNGQEDWHVTVTHGPGSVEHFHHFLLGFLVPIIYQTDTVPASARPARLIVRSCGPLDCLMREFIDETRLEILEKHSHRRMALEAGATSATLAKASAGDNRNVKFMTVKGADYPETYNGRMFSRVRQILLASDKVKSELCDLSDNWPQGNGRVLLVQRGRGSDFYNSDQSEYGGSGQDRRSIANHDELYESLLEIYPACCNVVLEDLSLSRQIALFALADVIIAQHGAALANIIWARCGTTVIEIVPNSLPGRVRDHDIFGNLAQCMGLRHRRVEQIDAHAEVDIDEIQRVAAQSMTVPPSQVICHLASAAYRVMQPCLPLKRRGREVVRRTRSLFRRARWRVAGVVRWR